MLNIVMPSVVMLNVVALKFIYMYILAYLYNAGKVIYNLCIPSFYH
jgi:hypothetical protein